MPFSTLVGGEFIISHGGSVAQDGLRLPRTNALLVKFVMNLPFYRWTLVASTPKH